MAVNGDAKVGKKSLILNAFVESCEYSPDLAHFFNHKKICTLPLFAGSGHQSPGLWRHPKDQSTRFNDVDHWTSLAQLLEKGKIHGIFIADVLGK